MSRATRKPSSSLDTDRKRSKTARPPAFVPDVPAGDGPKTSETLMGIPLARPLRPSRAPGPGRAGSSSQRTPVSEPPASATPTAASPVSEPGGLASPRPNRAPKSVEPNATTQRARVSEPGPMWALPDDTPPPVERPRAVPDARARAYRVVASRAEESLPTLERYLASLPDGLKSFPASRARGLTVRTLVLDPIHPLTRETPLPEPLEQMAQTPPAEDGWVPQVWLSALHAVAYDRAFADHGGVEAFEEWMFQRNVRLLKHPTLKGVMKAPDASKLFEGHAARWPAFYRGTSLRLRELGKTRAVFELAYPPQSWPSISRTVIVAALRAAATVVGAKSATGTTTEESAQAAHVDIRWQ